MPDQTPLDVEAIRARLDAALAHIRECMHIGLQDAKLYDEPGRKRIGEWADFIDKEIHAALAAPEMPRPPAEEAPTEYMVVVPSLCGSPTDYQMSYRTDRVRKPNRDAAIEHGLDAEGHDDFLIALVVGDTLTGLAWMNEDRDDAEEIAEAAEALELASPEPANGTAQPGAGDTDTSGTGSGRGTGVAEAPGTAQGYDGWTIARHSGGVALYDDASHHPALAGDSIPLGAVLAFIDDLPSLPVPSTEDSR